MNKLRNRGFAFQDYNLTEYEANIILVTEVKCDLPIYRKIEVLASVPLYALFNTTATTQLHPRLVLTLSYYTSV